MEKTTLIGVVLEQTPSMITMQEGDAVARYSKDYYRLPIGNEREPLVNRIERKLPVELVYGEHAVLAPVYL